MWFHIGRLEVSLHWNWGWYCGLCKNCNPDAEDGWYLDIGPLSIDWLPKSAGR